ncbi:MAG: MBL fold metallo-hydrolase [Betaproteobacteria bacterium]|nr:MBL fold metallo-hydrolase [Betaproteobacteria bacterium]
MRFASLASGSKGNCLVAEAGASRVLIDCGLSPRETAKRLARLGLAPGDLCAILVTHEHDDHVGHAYPFAAQHALPVYLTHGTRRAQEDGGKSAEGVELRLIEGREPFAVGDIRVEPFTVPHDAREPVQFVLGDGAWRLGVLTDLGTSTAHVEAMLSACDALVLETNHDLDLLWGGEYPKWLKERIGGPFGHLDNAAAGRLLAALDCSRLKHVIAAHLSQQNNNAALARTALAGVLGCADDWVGVATQDEGFGWRDLA